MNEKLSSSANKRIPNSASSLGQKWRIGMTTGMEHVTEIAGSVTKRPTSEQIAVLAYHLWLERQQQDGYADQDWLRAEEQLQKAAF